MNADELVRKLAESNPMDEYQDWKYVNEWRKCFACDVRMLASESFVHTSSCPWAAAREYVANAPVASQEAQDSPIVARVDELLGVEDSLCEKCAYCTICEGRCDQCRLCIDRICEGCQLEADTLYNNIHGAQLCADCIEGEA